MSDTNLLPMNYFKYAFLFIFSLSSWGFDCAPVTSPIWQEVSEGVSWTKFNLAFTPYNKSDRVWQSSMSRSVTVRALKIDLSKNKLRFLSPEHHVSCNPASERYIANIINESKAPVIAAINANFFTMPAGKILGLAIDDQTIWSDNIASQSISSSGVFGILNSEYFLETKDKFLEQYGPVISGDEARKYEFAVQAYPRLVNNQVITVTDSVLNSRRARTSIGIDAKSNEVLLVTIDARGEDKKSGMTLYEYAHFVESEKCGVSQKLALNLDGGGSTAFAIPSQNIFEQADRCRKLGNIITVQKQKNI